MTDPQLDPSKFRLLGITEDNSVIEDPVRELEDVGKLAPGDEEILREMDTTPHVEDEDPESCIGEEVDEPGDTDPED